MSKPEDQTGMTAKEKEAMEHLVDFWNTYLTLAETNDPETTQTVRNAVHVIQGVLAIRIARRVDPDIWR